MTLVQHPAFRAATRPTVAGRRNAPSYPNAPRAQAPIAFLAALLPAFLIVAPWALTTTVPVNGHSLAALVAQSEASAATAPSTSV